MLAPDAALVAILGRTGGCKYVTVELDVMAKCCIRGVCTGSRAGFSAASYLGVYLSAAAAAISGSKIRGKGVAVICRVHVWVVFATTVLLSSLVMSATSASVLSWA